MCSYFCVTAPEIVEFLIDSGANVYTKLFQGKTPLHYAAEGKDLTYSGYKDNSETIAIF